MGLLELADDALVDLLCRRQWRGAAGDRNRCERDSHCSHGLLLFSRRARGFLSTAGKSLSVSVVSPVRSTTSLSVMRTTCPSPYFSPTRTDWPLITAMRRSGAISTDSSRGPAETADPA